MVADLDLGWKIWLRDVSIRLAGINTPELDTADGKLARDALKAYLDAPIRVTSQKLDKYGRVLGDVEIMPVEMSLSKFQLTAGRAVPYNP